jgi:hypothetical protein
MTEECKQSHNLLKTLEAYYASAGSTKERFSPERSKGVTSL